MNELIMLLNSAIEYANKIDGDPKLTGILRQSIQVAQQQCKALEQENCRLVQIISDVRERDSRKNCLCRGMGKR